MKINKVDDKPVVIHTKAKAKIHSHKPREASIKGGNVYTVSKSSRIRGNSIADSVAYKNGAERIKAKARSQYRRSTVHSIDRDSIREIGIRRLRQNIRESNMPIKTAKTNLHIAGTTATKTTVDQLEGGEEVMQASMLAYELSRPANSLGMGWNSLSLCPNCAAEYNYCSKKISGIYGQVMSTDIEPDSEDAIEIIVEIPEGRQRSIKYSARHFLAMKKAFEVFTKE